MLVFIVESQVIRVMTEYLDRVKLYLKQHFNINSVVVVYGRGNNIAINPVWTDVVFVQKIQPSLYSSLKNPNAKKVVPNRQPAPRPQVPRPVRISRGVRGPVSRRTPQIPTPPITTPPPQLKSPDPEPAKATHRPRVFLLNTEQITHPTYSRKVLDDIKKYRPYVIDYSVENITLLQRQCRDITFIHFPFPFTPTANPQPKSEQVASLGNSQQRKTAIGHLRRAGINVADFFGKWGTPRDTVVARSKVLVNVHYSTPMYNIFESIRCYHALEMRTLVVSEGSIQQDAVLLKDYIVFSLPGKLLDTTQLVLKNYDLFYNQVFNERRLKELEMLIRNSYTRGVTKIRSLASNL